MREFQKVKLKLELDKSVKTEETIDTPQKMVEFVNKIESYDNMAEEYVIVIALSTKNKPIAYTEIAKGSERFCNVDLTSIFKFVILANANKFILVHNHPFQSIVPSNKDLEVTKELKKASKIMKLTFLDHIIITGKDYVSIMSILD